jgi:NADH-quinone oxidoreductase subunit M
MWDYKPYSITLAVLAIPAISALLCAMVGRLQGGAIARRLAIWLAFLHLAGTILLVLSLYPNLENRNLPHGRFEPMAVPGDTHETTSRVRGNTTWNLLQIGPEVPEARVPPPYIQFFVGIDGINLWLIPLASLITLCSILLTVRDSRENSGAFLAWLFLLETGAIGAFLSFDVILFFAFFELTLVPAFFLIGRYGVGGGKRDAARKFFLYTLFGGALTLIGIVGAVATNPIPLNEAGNEYIASVETLSGPAPKAGGITFSIPKLMRYAAIWDLYAARTWAKSSQERADALDAARLATTPAAKLAAEQKAAQAAERMAVGQQRRTTSAIIFFALMAGFAVKLPLIPFHTWLPAAYGEAPAGVTMFLSAVLAKLGAFGMLRLAIPLCAESAAEYGMSVFGTLAAIGIVYAAFCAFAQTDIKRLAAYSSVSHLGLLALGIFALNQEGLSGATFHMLAHGLSAGLMFGLLAFLSDRFGTLDSNRFGGLFARFPMFGFFFMIAVLAGVGLPGLCNFVGEMLIIGSLFDLKNASSGSGPAIAACAGVFLSAWYSFTLVRRVFFGPPLAPPTIDDAPAKGDVTVNEVFAFGLLAALCLALGILPQTILKPIAAESRLLAHLNGEALLRLDAGNVNVDRLQREAWRTPDRFLNPDRTPPDADMKRPNPPRGPGQGTGPAPKGPPGQTPAPGTPQQPNPDRP